MRRTALRVLVALIALLAVAAFAGAPAHAATCSPARAAFPLHAAPAASCGQHVSDLQWLLHGGKPYAMNQVKPTFKPSPNGAYGARTKSAVLAMKFRIGYPKLGECGSKTTLLRDTTTRYFLNVLKGIAKRPRCWVALAAERVKGAVREGATAAAYAIQALELKQLGVHEVPSSSNRGPRISYTAVGFGPYQGATGQFGAAWCASFAQWAIHAITGNYFADRSAYVPYIADWAQKRNLLAAKPRVGSLVVFLSANLRLVNAFHIGFVVRVTATGVQTIEGNSGTAYGGSVREVWRTFVSNHMVYVNVPGIA